MVTIGLFSLYIFSYYIQINDKTIYHNEIKNIYLHQLGKNNPNRTLAFRQTTIKTQAKAHQINI